jgi:hypothetical protein
MPFGVETSQSGPPVEISRISSVSLMTLQVVLERGLVVGDAARAPALKGLGLVLGRSELDESTRSRARGRRNTARS